MRIAKVKILFVFLLADESHIKALISYLVFDWCLKICLCGTSKTVVAFASNTIMVCSGQAYNRQSVGNADCVVVLSNKFHFHLARFDCNPEVLE